MQNDDRETVLWWEIPMITSSSYLSWLYNWFIVNNDNTTGISITATTVPISIHIGFVGADIRFWIISFAMLMIQSLVNVLVALIMYYVVVCQQQEHPIQFRQQVPPNINGEKSMTGQTMRLISPLSSYIFVYGIICPSLLYLPFLIVQHCELHNLAYVICITGATPAILFFKCIATVHGTLSPFIMMMGSVTSSSTTTHHHHRHHHHLYPISLKSFIMQYVSAIPFQWDPNTGTFVPFMYSDLWKKVCHFGSVMLQTTILYSIVLPHHYQVFPRRPIHTIVDLLYWGNIANHYMMASLTALTLDAGASGIGILMSILFGLQTVSINHSPLTQSSSPSDFWGRRWDVYVAHSLRQGVYVPLRQDGTFSPAMSILATFFVSGVLHEYILIVMRQVSGTTPVQYGHQFAFFLWCAIIILCERAIKANKTGVAMIKYVSSMIPYSVRTMFVVMTVLPLAFLFIDEYVVCGFYNDLAMGFPRIVIRSTTV
jgi:hypothetical protein